MSSSPYTGPPNLIVLAGPNGSGKSTLFSSHLAKWKLPFVNPDIIAKEIAPDDPANAALRATHLAEDRRQLFFEERSSFVTEGIRPDPKLLKRARALGYFTRVIFVCVESPNVNVTRVAVRVSKGGHSVPEDAIVARYDRALKSLPEAVELAHQLFLVDNTGADRPHRLIAHFREGKLSSLRAKVPAWAASVFAKEFEQFRQARPRR